jgi:thymidylate kinase
MAKIVNLEGIHGAGKTTQARLLEKELNLRGISTEYICSSDKPLSEKGMEFLGEYGPQKPETLFYLSLANNFSIQDRLNNSPRRIILLDRYIYTDFASTLVGGVDYEWINHCLKPFRNPDFSFLIDISPDEALRRKEGVSSNLEKGTYQQSNGATEGFVDYQSKLREAYLIISSKDPILIKINGQGSPLEVHRRIMSHLEGEL